MILDAIPSKGVSQPVVKCPEVVTKKQHEDFPHGVDDEVEMV